MMTILQLSLLLLILLLLAPTTIIVAVCFVVFKNLLSDFFRKLGYNIYIIYNNNKERFTLKNLMQLFFVAIVIYLIKINIMNYINNIYLDTFICLFLAYVIREIIQEFFKISLKNIWKEIEDKNKKLKKK